MKLLRVRRVLSGIAIAAVVFGTVWTLHAQSKDNAEAITRLDRIAADTQATLAELRAAIAAGPPATKKVLDFLIEEMQKDHDALLRAIQAQDHNTVIIREPAPTPKKTTKPKPSPSPTPTCQRNVLGMCRPR